MYTYLALAGVLCQFSAPPGPSGTAYGSIKPGGARGGFSRPTFGTFKLWDMRAIAPKGCRRAYLGADGARLVWFFPGREVSRQGWLSLQPHRGKPVVPAVKKVEIRRGAHPALRFTDGAGRVWRLAFDATYGLKELSIVPLKHGDGASKGPWKAVPHKAIRYKRCGDNNVTLLL